VAPVLRDDPSLRLKNGYAQDDTVEHSKLHYHAAFK
jgi:hypothetical protein